MWIKKSEIERLSTNIRKIIDGQDIDIRDNREGMWRILKNDIHTLAMLKNEQVNALRQDKTALKDTLADISYQLKTPLTSMLLMADLLDRSTSGGISPKHQTEFIENIKTGLTRMEWLTSALLKIAKLDAGAVEFVHEPVRSRELAELALEPLLILLEVKNQHVALSGEITLHCDKRWTSEALSNILKNASEYSSEGSQICIKSGENPICSWVSVTDSGAGIPSVEIAKLFKRFEGSRSVQGYGIGLPLALAIMRGQNGDIDVDSGNSGTTFTLKFFK